VPPIHDITGMPKMDLFKATSPSRIVELMQTLPHAHYIEAVMAKPMIKGWFFAIYFM
jgi:hypothetical protein